GGARRPYFGINAVTHIDEDRCNKLETCPATNLLAFPHWAPVIRRVGVIDDGRAYLDTGWENFGALKPQHRFKDPFSSASSRGRVTRRRVAAVWTRPESSRPRYLQVECVFADVGRCCCPACSGWSTARTCNDLDALGVARPFAAPDTGE